MKIKMDFIPDLIIYFEKENNGSRTYLKPKNMWGNSSIYEYVENYIYSKLVEKENCLFMIKKGCLSYNIIPVEEYKEFSHFAPNGAI